MIDKKAAEMGSEAFPVDQDSYRGLNLDGGRLRLTALTREREPRSLVIPFAAEYQAVNSLLAFRAAEILEIPVPVIQCGINQAVWPGRMEQIKENVYLDGAHNEGGIREFARAARAIVKERGTGRKILLFAVVSDKEYGEMAEIFCREFMPDVLILTQIRYSRGLDIHELDRAAHEAWRKVDPSGRIHDIRVVPAVAEALSEALREKQEEDTVFCAGSLYLIGEIKEVLKEE